MATEKATRMGYAEGLLVLGEKNDNVVVLDADLAGATYTGKFKAKFPERFFDCGIVNVGDVCQRTRIGKSYSLDGVVSLDRLICNCSCIIDIESAVLGFLIVSEIFHSGKLCTCIYVELETTNIDLEGLYLVLKCVYCI